MTFDIIKNPNAKSASERAALLADPGFGKIFTDHMVTIRFSAEKGWHSAKIEPYAPLQLDPAACVLHYAQEIFEGLKAYRLPDGGMALFRPHENAKRLNLSASRMAMPELPEALFIEALETLVSLEKDWTPDGEGSLYLRPFMIATEAFLGVRPANEYLFCIIASPAGPYFKGGRKGVSIWASENYTRAAPGGTGAAKCGGTYAASLAAQSEAQKNGCDQVVFFDAATHQWTEELGGMNVFFAFKDGSLKTPALSGTILPGITRKSILQLAQDMGHKVSEVAYGLDQWRADVASGQLSEVFACGTAAVIASIAKLKGKDFEVLTPETALADKIYDHLTKLQRGQTNDPHGWVYRIA